MNHTDNQELLPLLVEHIPVAVAMFDCQMRYLLVSRRWLVEHGLGEQDVIGCSYYELEREVSDDWKAIHQRVLAGAIEKQEELFLQDGTAAWVKWELCPWRNSTGEIGGLFMSKEAIAEPTWAAQALQQSEERFRSLVAGVNDYAIISLDREGHVVSWNTGAEHIKGYKSQEIIGQHFSCFYDREDIEQGKPQQNLEVAASAGRFEDEGWRIRKDGSLFWADVVITALRDQNGQLLSFCEVTRDITERKQADEYLRLLERAVAASSEGIVITDARTRDNPMIYVNPSFEQMTGYRKWEAVSRNCRFLHRNDTDQPGLAQLRAAIKEGRECKVVLRNYRKDGTLFWNQLRIAPVRNAEGKLTNFVGVQTDITERIQAEDKLTRISKAVESASDAISISNVTGHSIYHNRAFLELFGYTTEQLNAVGGAAALYGNPHVARQVLRASAKENSCWSGEVEMRTRNGCTIPILLRADAIKDEQGNVVELIGIHTDITERKQAEEVLRQSEAKNRALLDAIPDAMFRIRKDGMYLDFKAAKDDDFAMPESAVIGMSVEEVLPPEVAKVTMFYVNQALSTGDIQIFEYQLLNSKVGSQAGCLDREARFVVNGSDEVLAIVRDISERKKVERLKNEFVSIVSHELRTPLTSVRGSLSLISSGVVGEIPAEAKMLVDIAYKNSERLILLINDILDIEKIESGRMDFNLEPLALMPIVEQAIEANRAYGKQFGVQLVLEQSLPDAKINVDRDRLLQVLTNFLSNAAKFSPANGTVLVSVSRHLQCESDELKENFSTQSFIRVAVTDNGSGIPEEFHSRIFQKFAQADSSDTRYKGGTGLGLSICKAIIEKLGGQIGFETEPNVRTTFYFDLPEWSEPPPPLIPQHGRILICEDDIDIAKLLSLMLQQEGLMADIAYNAAQAKQLLVQHSYVAMTVDLALPGQSGISLIRELREQEDTKYLPIVVVSAKAQQGCEELKGGGFAVIDWLDKPINQERLIASVRQAVRQQADSKPRILYVEDEPDLTQVISAVLQDIAELEAAANLQVAKQKLEHQSFALVLLDLSLPDGSGLELLPYLNNQTRDTIPVVLFSAREVGMEAAHQVAAILVKSRTSNQQLLDTIKSLIRRNDHF